MCFSWLQTCVSLIHTHPLSRTLLSLLHLAKFYCPSKVLPGILRETTLLSSSFLSYIMISLPVREYLASLPRRHSDEKSSGSGTQLKLVRHKKGKSPCKSKGRANTGVQEEMSQIRHHLDLDGNNLRQRQQGCQP